MKNICQRKTRSLENHSQLVEYELYSPIDSFGKQLYTYVPDQSHHKRLSDRWTHGKKHSETIQTYADHFQEKNPRISLPQDGYLIALRGWRRPKINYLKMSSKPDQNKSNDSNQEPIHLPIEYLRYAPLTQEDYQIFARLPSLLVRICQLYRIEKLRRFLADNVRVDLVSTQVLMTLILTRSCLRII